MMEYDSQVIKVHAQQLHDQAKSITLVSTILYTIIGAAIGMYVPDLFGMGQWFVFLSCAALAGGFGYDAGKSKSFQLRLAAQNALIQVQIEENTRT